VKVVSQHEHLLHTEVRKLSKRRVQSRLLGLKQETKQFLRERQSPLGELFLDQMLINKLAYLVDVFCHLNKLNFAQVTSAQFGQTVLLHKLKIS